MAILPDAPSIYKIEAQFLWAGEKAENVHYLSVFGTSPQPDVDDVAAAYVAWFNATGKGQMANDTALQQVVVTDLTTHSAPRVFYTTGLPIAGASPDDSVANNVAPIVNWGIGERYRGGHPRTMHIGWPETWTNTSTLDATRRTALVTSYEALKTALEGVASGALMVMVSYYHNRVLRTDPAIFALGAPSVNAIVGSMKTRLPGHRRKKKPTAP